MMFKNLTLLLIILVNVFTGSVQSAEIFTFVKKKDFLRLELNIAKDQVVVSHHENIVELKTLNASWFESFRTKFKNNKIDSKYISKIEFIGPTPSNNISNITIILKDKNIELFSYYKDRDRKQIVDFWSEVDTSSSLGTNKKVVSIKISKGDKKNVSKNKKTRKQKISYKRKKNVKKLVLKKLVLKKKVLKAYRDFRYGAPFIWDYQALTPKVERYLDITLKTPEYFFPIKDVDYKKNQKNAHLQLSINLYRKKSWGLMFKSITLYHKKYGEDEDYDINEYLKVNSIIRQNLKKGVKRPIKVVISTLDSILKKTKNYELKKSIFKYLLSYQLKVKDFISVLKLSKKFYVASKENFDYEESPKALEYILYSLSQLGQLDQVKQLASEKTVLKLMSKQTLLAYKSFIYLKLKKHKLINDMFNKYKKSFVKPIAPALLFNVAESYFQVGKLDLAIKLFDQFIVENSMLTKSAQARLRIALAYEMKEGNINETIELYKIAINHSQSDHTSYEARIRLTALLNVRKIKSNKKDKQYRSLISFSERDKLSDELQELLWLVKLRLYIVDKKFKYGMNYLKGLPLISLKASKRRVYIEDGSEIVYGLIDKFYREGKFANTIRTWEIYKKSYLDQVANDPYLNFIIGESYLRLGLYDSFTKAFSVFKKYQKAPEKNYPLWSRRRVVIGSDILLNELLLVKAIKLNQIAKADKLLSKIKKVDPTYPRNYYYKGSILFKKQEYRKAITQFELFLIMPRNNKFLNNTEMITLLNNYVESIYEIKDLDKFLKVSRALYKDINLKENKFNLFKRKILYYQIEILVSVGENTKQLKNDILRYQNDYGFNNEYGNRVKYLLGQSLLKEEKIKDAKKIFAEIIKTEGITEYLKEMAKTDLSLISIKERTL